MRLLLACSILLASSLGVQADVYKCRSDDGRLIFSNSPCPNSANTVEVRADEKISAEVRAQRERDLEKMRRQAEQLEAARTAQKMEQPSQQGGGASGVERNIPASSPSLPPDTIQNENSAVGDPVVNCMLRVERSALSELEKQKLLTRCQGGRALVVPGKPFVNQPSSTLIPATKKIEPPVVDPRLPPKGAGQSSGCVEGDKNCTRALLRP